MASDQQQPQSRRVSPIAALRMLLKNYFFAILGAAAIAFFVRVYVMEAFRIPTDFMAPTLLPGDHIFVNKLAFTEFPLSKADPQRGDVVIFSFPNDPRKEYIKRVIGVPGDVVEIQDGHVLVNGKDTMQDEFEVNGNHRYGVLWDGAESRKMMPVTVPSENVFVLGDNRAKGQDSRSWGFLPVDYIKGKASVIWFSIDNGVRWSRILNKVD